MIIFARSRRTEGSCLPPPETTRDRRTRKNASGSLGPIIGTVAVQFRLSSFRKFLEPNIDWL